MVGQTGIDIKWKKTHFSHMDIYGFIDRQIGKQMDEQTNRWMDRQTRRWTAI
jgi:hypothetical protein